MKYNSLSKSKYTSCNFGSINMNKKLKPKENSFKLTVSNASTLVVDKEGSKILFGTFRPGPLDGLPVTGNKFRTTERSDYANKQVDRNFSGERKQLLEKNKIVNNSISNNITNINTNTNTRYVNGSSKLKEIIEEGVENFLKNKILKKKEKIKANIINFSNPFSKLGSTGSGFYKLHLETSTQNNNPSYLQNLKKELGVPKVLQQDFLERSEKGDRGDTTPYKSKSGLFIQANNHKRCSSLFDDEELASQRNEVKKSLMSPRMENVINKYYDLLDKNDNLSLDKKKNFYMSKNIKDSKANYSITNNESLLNPYSGVNIKCFNNTNFIKKINSQITKAGHNLSNTQKSINYKPDVPNYSNNNTNTTHNNSSNMHGENSKRSNNREHEVVQNKQGVSKTAVGSKKNSRKNSIDKSSNLKITKNLFLAANPQKTLKASTNTSTNNSFSTLLSNHNPNKYTTFNNMNVDIDRESHIESNTGFSNLNSNLNSKMSVDKSISFKKNGNSIIPNKSGFHSKMYSEIPVLSSVNMKMFNNNKNSILSSNVISNNFSKDFLYINTNLKYQNAKQTKNLINSTVSNNQVNPNNINEDEMRPDMKAIKKKIGTFTIPVTTVQSKVNSKNNSKSMSRIEEFNDTKPYSIKGSNLNNVVYTKTNSLIRKHIPITTSHSPTHFINKDFIVCNYKKENEVLMGRLSVPISPAEPVMREKINIKNLELGNIQNKINQAKRGTYKMYYDSQVTEVKKTIDDGLLNISNDSVKSTMRESYYFRRESEKVSNFIKQHYFNNKEYPKTNSKFYKYGRLLGRGAFGKVNLGLHVGAGRLVAIKSFNKSKLTTDKSKRRIVHETNLLKLLKHPSIVKFYENFDTSKYILIVMEYVSCGDLLNFVRKRSKLNETTAKFIFKQIIEALQYIHSQGVVHRDIKLDNILIDLQNNIKICDFGVSKQIRKGDVMHDQCGTPAYIAPEILKNQGYEGFGVDVWSAGVVLYAMLSGTVPFRASNMNELNSIIIKGAFQGIKEVSEEAQHLINSLLEVDPKKRITIDQILSHSWIKSQDNKMRNKMNLFTAAEKILLAKSNIDYRFADKADIIENFTMRNLDTLQEAENQNINTKSVILAPFNSSLRTNDSFLHQDLIIENEVLKLCGKVKQINRHYELNNNGEIDNGIIISPQADSNDNTPIYSPYSPSPFNNSFNGANNKIISKPILPKNKGSKLNSPSEESIHKTLIKNGNNLHSLNNPFAINEKIIKKVEEFGYKKDYILEWLLNNDINYATAAYYLFFSSDSEY